MVKSYGDINYTNYFLIPKSSINEKTFYAPEIKS